MEPRLRYDEEDDVLLVWFSKKLASKAEISGPVVVHVSNEGEPVLLEIMGASAFIENLTDVIAAAKQVTEKACPSAA